MKLLSIVGDDISRIIPVLYLYKGMAKEHILLCDDTSNHQRAKNLQNGMKNFSKKHHLNLKIKIVTTNEDSKEEMQLALQKKLYETEELWLNAFNPWLSHGNLDEFFSPYGESVIAFGLPCVAGWQSHPTEEPILIL